MEGISDTQAAESVAKLKRYCEETGCLYCQYRSGEECRIRYPREWREEEC